MKNIIYGLCAILLLSGCSDFLKEYSQSQTTARTVAHFDETLLGSGYIRSSIIEYLRPNNAGWLNVLDDDISTTSYYSAGKLWAGVMTTIYGYYAWQYEVGRNIQGNDLAADNQTWSSFYGRINVTNIILHEIDDIAVGNAEEEADRIRVKGECHFLRAQLYFTLINLYAKAYDPATAATDPGVPLKLTEYVEHDKESKTQFQRTPVAEVYKQIISDLEEAVKCLTKSPQSRPLHRASKEAAQLLLSRTHLYMQNWEKARQAASGFLEMKSELYQMGPADAGKAFLTEENVEVLFSQGPLNIQNCINGDGGDFCVTKELWQTFDTIHDCRRFFFGRSMNSDSIMLGSKYRKGINFTSHVSDIFTLRTAEGYLIMAEACALSGDAAEANLWLSRLKQARITGYQHTDLSGSALITEIRNERRRELCFEGHRWFDLRRYAVCKDAPFKKEIYHEFNHYHDLTATVWDRADIFLLEKDDPAYVFQIPKAVLDYDEVPMEDNPRNKRLPIKADITEP